MDYKKADDIKRFSYESRIVIIALLAVLVPLMIFAAISIYSSSQALTSQIRQELQDKSALVTYNISNFINERIVDAKLLSQADVLEKNNMSQTVQYLTEIVEANKWINDIDLIDLSGIIIASSGEQNEKNQLFIDSYPTLKTLYLSTTQASQGDVFISDVQMLDTGPGLLFMTPVTDDSNQILVGVLTLEVNLQNISQVVALFDKGIIGNKYVYIIDNDGRVVVTADPGLEVFSSLPDLQVQPDLLTLFTAQGAVGNSIYTDLAGDKVMAGYSDMAEFGANQALDWSIIAIAPLDEITRSAQQMQNLLLLTGLLIALLAMSIVYWFLLRSKKILQKMAAQADQISQGDFSQQLPLNSQDKSALGSFLIAFNRMVVSTREMMAEVTARELDLAITLNSIGDAVITTDTDGHVNRMNPVAERLTGWSLQQARKKPLQVIFPIVDASTRKPIENPVERVFATGDIVYLSNHTTLLAKDGREYQIADSAAPIRNSDNQITGMVLVFNDVTEAYRLREQAKSVQQQLQRVFDDMQTMVGILECDGSLIFVNNTPLKAAGIKQKDVINKKVWDCPWFTYDARLQRSVENDIREAAGGKNILRDIQVSMAGGLLWIEFSIHPVFNEQGEVIQMVAEGRDVSKRLEKEELLRRAQKMDALGKLTGGVAHDYNNMLGVVIGYAELLERSLDSQPKLANYASQISRAGQRGAKLTRKLLSFSRMETGEAQRIDINVLLNDMQHMLEKMLTVRIKLGLQQADNLWSVYLDGSELEDAILNISINAMHAMDGRASAQQLMIKTSNQQLDTQDAQSLGLTAGEYIRLSLIDTGYGMDASTREQIFDPFFTTKGDKGTGLGLSQVFGFVTRAGGTIKVYSEPDHGSKFSLYFPRYQENAEQASSAGGIVAASVSGNETVLVVDDEPALLNLTAEILELHGFHVLQADSAKKAIEILQTETVDLMISDVIMPEMDGYQLAAYVKEHYPDIKIQLASGFTDESHVAMIDDELQLNLLYKPFGSQVLMQRVRELLNRNN